MAEVRLGLGGRGAYNIAINTHGRSFSDVRSSARRGSPARAPSLSRGSRLDSVPNSLSNTARVHRHHSRSLLLLPRNPQACWEASLFPRSVVVVGGDTGLYHQLPPQEETLLLLQPSTWGCCDAHDDDTTSTRSAQRSSNPSRGYEKKIEVVTGGTAAASSFSRFGTTTSPLCHPTRRRPSAETPLSCRRVLLGHHMQQQLVFVRSFSGRIGDDEPLYKSRTGYYDVLEVSPDATHAQIKTAYYRLSFVYHPDKNAGSEDATDRFSDISEAYNVLGNKTLRKKYDRGILSQSDLAGASRPSSKDAGGGSAKQPERSQRSSVIDADGKNVFDFDNYIKSHYKDQIQKGIDMRQRKEEMLRKKTETVADWKLGRLMEMGVGVIVALAVGIIFSIKR